MTWLPSSSDPPSRPDSSAGGPSGPLGMLLAIEVEVSDEVATMVIIGELDLTTGPLLAERLSATLRAKPRRLILDMAGTSFLDCSSARLIVSAGQGLPDGQRPVIRHPSRAVRRVLELTGLDAGCEIEG